VEGLKFVPRNPDFYFGGWLNHWEAKNHIRWFAQNFGAHQVILGGDLDACDNACISEQDWVSFLCRLSDVRVIPQVHKLMGQK
jgi:hypothetical protein